MVPLSGIRKMFNLAQKYRDAINLCVGEPDFDTPDYVVEAAIDAMRKGYTHYTSNAGLMEFREAAAEKLKKENGIDADAQTEIIATVGAMGGLSLAMLTIVNPGDEVLIPDPGFPSYNAQVILAEGKPVHYPLDEKENFAMSPEKLSRLVTRKTRAIMLNTPSNPTGTVLNEKHLKAISEIAIENDLLVISDEPYEAITYENFKHISIASLPEMKKKTITTFSFSKSFAMTGWRIGFAVASKDIASQMNKLQEHVSVHPSSISQMAAVAALRGPRDHLKMMVKEYSERRELIFKELTAMPKIKCIKPQGAFYVFPDIKAFGRCSEAFAIDMLEKARIAIVPGTAFGENGEGHVRISYATSKQKIADAMARMKKALARNQKTT